MKNFSGCDSCMNYYYDDEYGDYLCAIQCFDEDEVTPPCTTPITGAPYYRPGDEYTIIEKTKLTESVTKAPLAPYIYQRRYL